MKPLDKVGAAERSIVDARRASGYGGADLVRFAGRLEPTLRAVLDRLLPGVPPGIDLAAFVDTSLDQPLGRGDRRAGSPPDLLLQGITILTDEGFADLDDEAQRDVISRMRRGDEHGTLGPHAKEFIDRLLDKALTGYLAHPATWERIGFNGPAYPEGYAWIGPDEVVARHDKKTGWDKL